MHVQSIVYVGVCLVCVCAYMHTRGSAYMRSACEFRHAIDIRKRFRSDAMKAFAMKEGFRAYFVISITICKYICRVLKVHRVNEEKGGEADVSSGLLFSPCCTSYTSGLWVPGSLPTAHGVADPVRCLCVWAAFITTSPGFI